MRRIFLFLIFFLISLTAGKQIYAVDAYNERWTCLNLSYPSSDKTIPVIPPVDESQYNGSSYQKYTHSGMVAAKGVLKDNPLPNSDAYIVECLQIPSTLTVSEEAKKKYNNEVPKEVCTTGSSTADKYIWNNDRLTMLNELFPTLNFRFIGYYKTDFITKIEPESSNKYVKTDKDGNFVLGKFALVSFTNGGFERKLMAYNRFSKAEPTPDIIGQGGQQQGKLAFDFESVNKDCVKIAWDPYGRVFDAQTLEPIPNATVSLKKKINNQYRLVNYEDVVSRYILNPYSAKEDGYFSFIVPDGTYKLESAASGYITAESNSKIHPNFSYIYSDLYYGEDIVQKGAMVHKDIPLIPLVQSSTQKYPAKLMGVFQTILDNGNTIIDGQVSHPFAKINAYCKTITGTRGTLNKSIQADKNGDFKLTFDPNRCNQNKEEMYAILETESIDLTGSFTTRSIFSRFLTWVTGQNKVKAAPYANTYTFDPLFNHMEGYAYDEQGEAIPNTTVGTYAVGDINAFRTVLTDKEGRFSLTTNQIPNAPYVLRYSHNGKLITTSTSRFISQNISVIKQDHIDLYTRSKETPSLLTSKNSLSPNISPMNSKNNPVSDISGNNSVGSMTQVSKDTSGSTAALKNQIITLIILMLVIGIIGIFITIYILEKK